jgi:hypothetical protein
MDTINYSFNPNGTVYHYNPTNDSFILLLPRNSTKHKTGNSFKIRFNNKTVKLCIIEQVISCTLKSIEKALYLRIIGLNKSDAIKHFSKIYNVPDAEIDQRLHDIVFFKTLSLYTPAATNSKQLCIKF